LKNVIERIVLLKNGGANMLMNNEIDFIKTIRDMSTEELMEIYYSKGNLENETMKKLYQLSGKISGTYSLELSLVLAYQELIERLLDQN
jgi:NADH:ubiquinone oxidoreductase subunit F (NADH-binding)